MARAINERTVRSLRNRPPSLSYGPVGVRLGRAIHRRRGGGVALATLGCAAMAGLGLWVRSKAHDPSQEALTYTVDGARGVAGSLVAASPSTTAPVVAFSDGTRVRLEPQARTRVVTVGRRGARIRLDEGQADVEVAHRPGAEWFFEAGPFLITVHGTAFTFEWNAQSAHLGVQMRSGVVSVSGPVSGGEVVLRAGQSLSLNLNGQGAPSASNVAGPDPEPAPTLAPVPAVANAPSGTTPAPDNRRPGPSWNARLAEGHAAEIVADARRRGIAKVLELGTSEDLAALADAARFERDPGLARRALLSQRRRFAGSGRAAEASFLLGRLDDAPDDSSVRALGWYDEYLKEAPDGTYVSEALGRKMMVLERSGNHPAATRIARQYLQRFPGGTYSRAARALVHEP